MNKAKQRDCKGKFKRRADGEMYKSFPVYEDAKGYKIIWLNGKDIKLHVYVWEQENGPKPKGYDIHHIDFDKQNYGLSNLELVSYSDHRKIHAGWEKTNGEWSHKPCTECQLLLPLSDFYNRKGYTPTAKCKKCHCKQTKEWQKNNPEKRKEIALKHYYKIKQGGKTHAGE